MAYQDKEDGYEEDLDLALYYLYQALEMHKRLNTGNHPHLANVYFNIGMVYRVKREFNTALEHLNKALEMNKRLYTGDHQELALMYNYIGNILTKGI